MRGERTMQIVNVPTMRKHQIFTPLVEVYYQTTLVSFNSRTSVFQTDDEGAIPSTRSIEPILREERGLQNRV